MMEWYETWQHLELAWPWALLLLLLIPVGLGWRRSKREVAFRISTTAPFKGLSPSWRVRRMPVLKWLRAFSLIFLILAIARPRAGSEMERIDSEGIDLVLSIDVSGSMQAEDLQPNRIEAAKQMATEFVKERRGDRIGLVIFSGESFTQCPVTIDHRILTAQIASLKSGILADGTAIGAGLASAVDRLRSGKGKSKVIILMTDGENNVSDPITPELALELAKTYSIKVYTIGVGTRGAALFPVQGPFGVQRQMVQVSIDEPLLQKIAQETGGRYFRATDNASLKSIYSEINQLEKSTVQVDSYKNYRELYYWFVMAALLFLVLEMILSYTVFRRLD